MQSTTNKKTFTKFSKKGYKSKFVERPFDKGNVKYLIIVESPSKCKKIEGFLGSEYKCIASKGHIRNISGLKSIDQKNNYKPKFSTIEEKEDHIIVMKGIIKQFDKSCIVLATDDDREGEAIAWHICDVFELDILKTKRIIFREITQKAIQDAIKDPTIIDMKLVDAQMARQVLDILVGYKISPTLWKLLYNNKENSLSAGRCQTPALRLVYDNEIEKNENIKSGLEKVYKTIGTFFPQKYQMVLNHEFIQNSEVLDFLEKTKTFKHILSIGNTKQGISSSPVPFNTSNLLQSASNVLHMSPKETMKLAQQLYQEGFITYMRTDSQKFSLGFLEEASKYIEKCYKSEFIGDLSKIENKDESNPHEAIRITHIETNQIISENKRLCSLYNLIWKNSVQSCMSPCKFNATTIKITAPNDHHYSRVVEVITFLGWKRIIPTNLIELQEREHEEQIEDGIKDIQISGAGLLHYLKAVDTIKPIPYDTIESKISIKNKHSHYSEASLIKKLEDFGIGRPSTFATIVDTIIERGYVKCRDIDGYTILVNDYKMSENIIKIEETNKVFGKENKKMVIQPVGIMTIEFLLSHFDSLFSYNYTKDLEKELDEIAIGKRELWYKTCENCTKQIKELMKSIKLLEKQVFNIDEEHVLVYEKFGAVLKTNTIYDGKPLYKSVKRDIQIDLNRLKTGGYTLEDLLEVKEKYLGEYKVGEEMVALYLRTGQYGPYVTYGDKTENLKTLKKPYDEITLEDIVKLLDGNKKDETSKNENILRCINENLSVRKGKYGGYIFYKRPDMIKPTFLNIKKFPEWYTSCKIETLLDWINKTYKLDEKI